ncbi:MAG: L,D-transpeptidase [Candidatus Nomurabacteria bacterium]|nr:L,D-transpeptidase [Candidatus Nomurabacteria bacterium]
MAKTAHQHVYNPGVYAPVYTLHSFDDIDIKPRGRLSKHHKLALWVVASVVIITTGLFVFTHLAFRGKVLPGFSLAGTNVSGKDRAELTKTVEIMVKAMKAKITVGDKTATATAKDLGVTVDVKKTVNNILDYKDTHPIAALNYLARDPAELVVARSDKKLQEYLNTTFVDQLVWVQEAGIQYDVGANHFNVTDAKPGTKLTPVDMEATITSMLKNPRAVKVKLTPAESLPTITNKAAEEAAEFMNARLGLRLDLTYRGRLVYYADPPDIARWVVATPKDGAIELTFNHDEIKRFLNGTVAPYIASAPIDEKVLVDSGGNVRAVLTSGQNGYKIRDDAAVAGALAEAVRSGTNMSKELDVEETGYSRVTIKAGEGEHWVEVNLSAQTATAWTGSTAIASWRISSGTAATPTLPGEFKVWHKRRVQTMKGVIGGVPYNVPNVEWISYFDADGRAFHATYWHNNFGTPMSHGCINMTYEAAEFIYNFAPIGTRVMIHY